ncbi:hypothetical protein [Acidovorax sp. 1608163]|uniref:hypothetical protein n=1 Tax=Acidovorax sp. 1608163 TaxID=2478662 RepID=UPI0013CECD73|nr:hypothetical protein [Acidovorax sp. 1608163]
MEPSFRRLETLRSSSCASFGACITCHKTALLAKTATLLGYTALKLAACNAVGQSHFCDYARICCQKQQREFITKSAKVIKTSKF